MNTTTLDAVPSERVAERATRILAERRLRVTYADGVTCYAQVTSTGGGESHTVTYDRQYLGGWHCTCLAHTLGLRRGVDMECSHIVACDAVWQPQTAQPAAPPLSAVPS